MSFPRIVAKLGFGYGPLDPSPVYTDVSGRLRGNSIQIARGRSDQLGDFDAGTVVTTLADDDGWLDPGYPSSPYAPNVVPDTPILFQAVYAGITYDLIKAHVERWPAKRISRFVADMPISASDLLATFEGHKFPAHDDGLGGGSGRIQFGSHNFNTNTWTNLNAFVAPDEGTRVYALVDASPSTTGPDIGHSDTLNFGVTYTSQNGATGQEGTLSIKYPEMSNHPYHKRSWQAEITVQLQGNDHCRSIQNVFWKSGKFYGNQMITRIYGERAILPRGKGDAQLTSALAAFGLAAPTVRQAGRFTQLPSSPWGQSLLDAIRQIQQTELGQIFVDRHGNVVFEDRDWRYNNWGTPAKWHDGATAGTSPYVYVDCLPTLDRDRVINRWEIVRMSRGPRDMPQKQVASQAGKVPIVGQRTVNIASDDTALLIAKYLLARTATPLTRVTQLTIKPLANPDLLFPAVLNMEIGDPIIVNRYIPIGNGQFYLNCLQMNIEHLTHTISKDSWETELELSPRITTAFPTA